MIYGYVCDTCKQEFDVVKTMTQVSSPETCPQCNTVARRSFSMPLIARAAKIGGFTPYYNFGLGEWVQKPGTEAKIGKSKGLYEIGSERVDIQAERRQKERSEAKEAESLKQEAHKFLDANT